MGELGTGAFPARHTAARCPGTSPCPLVGVMGTRQNWKSCGTSKRVHTRAGGEATLILAINGGEDPRKVAEICREHHLTFTVVPDPHHGISRLYQVNCWPATVPSTTTGASIASTLASRPIACTRRLVLTRRSDREPKPARPSSRARNRLTSGGRWRYVRTLQAEKESLW